MLIYHYRYTATQISRFIACFFVSALIITYTFSSAYASPTALFNKEEMASTNLKPFKKWLTVLEKYASSSYHISPGELCKKTEQNSCEWKEWNYTLGKLKNKTFLHKIKKINHFINQHAYIVDPINWGMKDYWATPQQFTSKNGDCEDYAIAKYISLKAMGIPDERMRIVILKDLNLDLLHAVLAVYGSDDNIYILDNQIPHVVKHTDIHHYVPIYSINEHFWWKHY